MLILGMQRADRRGYPELSAQTNLRMPKASRELRKEIQGGDG